MLVYKGKVYSVVGVNRNKATGLGWTGYLFSPILSCKAASGFVNVWERVGNPLIFEDEIPKSAKWLCPD